MTNSQRLSRSFPQNLQGLCPPSKSITQVRYCRLAKSSSLHGWTESLLLIRQTVIMAMGGGGVFPKWLEAKEEGSIHSIWGCWGKPLKAVPGLLTVGNIRKVKRRVFRAERTMSSMHQHTKEPSVTAGIWGILCWESVCSVPVCQFFFF